MPQNHNFSLHWRRNILLTFLWKVKCYHLLLFRNVHFSPSRITGRRGREWTEAIGARGQQRVWTGHPAPAAVAKPRAGGSRCGAEAIWGSLGNPEGSSQNVFHPQSQLCTNLTKFKMQRAAQRVTVAVTFPDTNFPACILSASAPTFSACSVRPRENVFPWSLWWIHMNSHFCCEWRGCLHQLGQGLSYTWDGFQVTTHSTMASQETVINLHDSLCYRGTDGRFPAQPCPSVHKSNLWLCGSAGMSALGRPGYFAETVWSVGTCTHIRHQKAVRSHPTIVRDAELTAGWGFVQDKSNPSKG